MASILLIDGDEIMLALTAEVLRMGGHTVDTAKDGTTGLALYKASLPDLVITDIAMSDIIYGLWLNEVLRKVVPRPRIIAISDGSRIIQQVYLPFANGLGIECILIKPVMPEELLKAVADVLAQSAPLLVRQPSENGTDTSAKVH